MNISDLKNTALSSAASVSTQSAKNTTDAVKEKSSVESIAKKYDLVSEDGDTVEISSAAKMSLAETETGSDNSSSKTASKPATATKSTTSTSEASSAVEEEEEDYSDLSQYSEAELRQLVAEGHITQQEMDDELASR